MAQSGFTPISIYHSNTAAAVPLAANLTAGELAINTADMKLYAKNNSGTVTLLASNASTTSTGTVTLVSVVSANGLAGTVATDTTTPAITLSTSVTGVLKGDGTAISAATAGTDYVTPTGTETLTNKTITGTKETRVAMGANDIDLSAGNWFTKTFSGTLTLTVSNVPTTGTSASFILDATNGGSATITWWSGVKWAGGIAPTLTLSGRDSLGFYTYDGGTTWTGLLLGKDIK